MDRTIYLLSQVMIADYRLEAAQVFYKVKPFPLSKSEKLARNRAEEVDENAAYSMIVKFNEEVRRYWHNPIINTFSLYYHCS